MVLDCVLAQMQLRRGRPLGHPPREAQEDRPLLCAQADGRMFRRAAEQALPVPVGHRLGEEAEQREVEPGRASAWIDGAGARRDTIR